MNTFHFDTLSLQSLPFADYQLNFTNECQVKIRQSQVFDLFTFVLAMPILTHVIIFYRNILNLEVIIDTHRKLVNLTIKTVFTCVFILRFNDCSFHFPFQTISPAKNKNYELLTPHKLHTKKLSQGYFGAICHLAYLITKHSH